MGEKNSFTQPIPWLLMTRQHMEPGHQQPQYWSILPGMFQLQHQSGWPFNSLTPGRFQRNFLQSNFQANFSDWWLKYMCISCKIVLKWMPMDLTDGKSTLVQVMAWCRQATSHYLNQCWPRSMSPYGHDEFKCWRVLNKEIIYLPFVSFLNFETANID